MCLSRLYCATLLLCVGCVVWHWYRLSSSISSSWLSQTEYDLAGPRRSGSVQKSKLLDADIRVETNGGVDEHAAPLRPSNADVAIVVPVHPPKEPLAAKLAESFTKFFPPHAKAYSTDLLFAYSTEQDRESSGLPEIMKKTLPTLDQMQRRDNGGVAISEADFTPDKGGRSETHGGPQNRLADIKQLYAIRELCDPDPHEGTRKAYKYVVFLDADTRIVRAPVIKNGLDKFSAILDEIYARKEFFAGTAAACGSSEEQQKACQCPSTANAGKWLAASDVDLKKDWTDGNIGYLFYNQLPFLSCADQKSFFEDIGFPPSSSSGMTTSQSSIENHAADGGAFVGKGGQRFEYLQTMYFSWLWARRGWHARFLQLETTSTSPGIPESECPRHWCNLERVGKACVLFPKHLLQQTHSLWVPDESWRKLVALSKKEAKAKPLESPEKTAAANTTGYVLVEHDLTDTPALTDFLSTEAFMVFHTDRDLGLSVESTFRNKEAMKVWFGLEPEDIDPELAKKKLDSQRAKTFPPLFGR